MSHEQRWRMSAIEGSNGNKMQSRILGMESVRVCGHELQFLNRMVAEGFLGEVMLGQRHGREENVLGWGSS